MSVAVVDNFHLKSACGFVDSFWPNIRNARFELDAFALFLPDCFVNQQVQYYDCDHADHVYPKVQECDGPTDRARGFYISNFLF